MRMSWLASCLVIASCSQPNSVPVDQPSATPTDVPVAEDADLADPVAFEPVSEDAEVHPCMEIKTLDMPQNVALKAFWGQVNFNYNDEFTKSDGLIEYLKTNPPTFVVENIAVTGEGPGGSFQCSGQFMAYSAEGSPLNRGYQFDYGVAPLLDKPGVYNFRIRDYDRSRMEGEGMSAASAARQRGVP